MKKKILYLSQMYPYPPDGGGKIKTLNTLRALSREYQVSAVFVSETKPTKEELYELEKLGITVKVFYSDRILASVKDDLMDLAWHFFRGIPHYVFQYTHNPAFPYVHKLIRDFKPDIIHVDHLNMAQYLPKEKHQVWILEHHNVETYLYWTRFLYSRKPTRKLYLFMEMILTFFYEWKTLRLFNHVFAISKVEEIRLRNIFHVSKTSTQPLAYPTEPTRRKPGKLPYILFIGNLGWPPNEDAVEWFLRNIFPLVLRELPNAEFHVVGKRQPRYEASWPKLPNVFLHGYQKNLDPFLAQAHAFVLPFWMGGGLRLKGLTALAAGVPVISTLLGVEGLAVRDGKEVLLAGSASEFAGAVVTLLGSPQLQSALCLQGKRYIKKYHSGKENKHFLAAYQEVIREFL
ncbi:glycosyltransferase [Candidatus Gottesmanbacteria bacterium]|nr:glycosyltransferase [Candidatus Gottesmanbacteria bacterium]